MVALIKAVVEAVELWARHQNARTSERKSAVRVVHEAPTAEQDQPTRGREQRRADDEGSRHVNREKAKNHASCALPPRGRGVHVSVAVVNRVHRPQQRQSVLGTMRPVLKDIPHERVDDRGGEDADHGVESSAWNQGSGETAPWDGKYLGRYGHQQPEQCEVDRQCAHVGGPVDDSASLESRPAGFEEDHDGGCHHETSQRRQAPNDVNVHVGLPTRVPVPTHDISPYPSRSRHEPLVGRGASAVRSAVRLRYSPAGGLDHRGRTNWPRGLGDLRLDLGDGPGDLRFREMESR